MFHFFLSLTPQSLDQCRARWRDKGNDAGLRANRDTDGLRSAGGALTSAADHRAIAFSS